MDLSQLLDGLMALSKWNKFSWLVWSGMVSLMLLESKVLFYVLAIELAVDHGCGPEDAN